MPLRDYQLSSNRIEFHQSLTSDEIRRLASSEDLKALQCSSPVELDTWIRINEELLPLRPEIEIRVYGFYSMLCDLSFVGRLTNLRHFSADCLLNAIGVENVASLQKLESLSIGIFSLENFDFLSEVTPTITRLALEATKSKKPRLNHLRRFRSLKTLYLEGQQRNIEVLAELCDLEDVTLRSISTPGLDYLAGLGRLWSLDIKLGGITDLSALHEKDSIEYLELWQTKSLRNIDVISTLYGLQYLFLQSLRNVVSLPDTSKLNKLRKIYLENMKALIDVSAISQAPSLQEFAHVAAQKMKPEQYAGLLKLPTLQNVSVGFGSLKKKQVFKQMMTDANLSEPKWGKFVFE
jgi:hypothetical protein